MNIYVMFLFVLAALIHFVYAKVAYAHTIIPDTHIIIKALILGILSQVGWVGVIKLSTTPESLFVYSLLYDAIIVLVWLSVALINVRLGIIEWIGITMVLGGLGILKYRLI